ncbi:MAG: ExeA family protein [Desulfobacteraceae bacterium]
MYNNYFGFSDSPFENTLDQRFLFLSEDHQEVLAALLYFVKQKKGLAIVCGDVGTGKTMLINTFLNRLPDSVRAILISNPLASYHDLLYFLAGEIGLPEKQDNILELVEQIKEALMAARQQGQDYILIVDEAHLLTDDSLEQVRLLSNIEVSEGKLLQILLVGQYELSHRLNRPEMRQLRQRINISRFLSPLSQTETIAYIDYRLKVVNSSFNAIFDPRCEKLLYRLTGGVPRRINQLCDNSLLSCMAEGLSQVNRQVLKKSHEALLTDVMFTPEAPAERKGKIKWLAVAAGLLAVVLIIHTLVRSVRNSSFSNSLRAQLSREFSLLPATSLVNVVHEIYQGKLYILATLSTPQVVSPQEVKIIQDNLGQHFQRPIELIIRCILAKDIGAAGSSSQVAARNLKGFFLTDKVNPQVMQVQLAEQALRELLYARPEFKLLNVSLLHFPAGPYILATLQGQRVLLAQEVQEFEKKVQDRLQDGHIGLVARCITTVDVDRRGEIISGQAHFGDLTPERTNLQDQIEVAVEEEIRKIPHIFPTSVDAVPQDEVWTVWVEAAGAQVISADDVALLQKSVSRRVKKDIKIYIRSQASAMVSADGYNSIQDFIQQRQQQRQAVIDEKQKLPESLTSEPDSP